MSNPKKKKGRARRLSRKARIAFLTFILIIIASLVVLVIAMFNNSEAELPQEDLPPEDASALVVAAGEAQLLAGYVTAKALPENPVSVELRGMMVCGENDTYATFEVDGQTATLIEGDYIGSWQVVEITENDVALEGYGEEVLLTLDNGKLNMLEVTV